MVTLTNTEKNKFIVEKVLGECWHEQENDSDFTAVCRCGYEYDPFFGKPNPDFYSSDPSEQAINFFRLWNCIKGKEWFEDFLNYDCEQERAYLSLELMGCAELADAVIECRGGEDGAE